MKKAVDEIFTYNKKYFFILGAILIIGVIVFFFVYNHNQNQSNTSYNNVIAKEDLILFGKSTITLEYGEKYHEPGFYAINSNGIVDTTNVTVSGDNFDQTIPGTYTITYQYKSIIKTRNIIILDSNSEKENNDLVISLKGEEIITLDQNQEYIEPGYTAKYKDQDLTQNVIVNSNLNTSIVGTYKIDYTITYNNETKSVTRNIVVINTNLEISLTPSTTNYTNSSVTISVNIVGQDFTYLTLPNGEAIKTRKKDYSVSDNGTYTFKAFNSSGKSFSKIITINNIDKVKPVGTCNATINNTNTVIKISASDDLSGIKNYVIKNNGSQIAKTTSKTYTYNKKTSKNVSVEVFDNATNSKTISCSVTDNSTFPVIKPTSDENVIVKEESQSLKVYISKFSNYYLTRIWVYNAYNQLNKYNSPEYGKKLYRPDVLLKNATDEYNLKNKFLLGFNASGFYLKDTYDASSVRLYPAYDKTSVGTIVITNGKVIRNVYDKGDLLTWFITGVTKDNKMVVFEDKKMKETNVNEKKAWSQEVINSGIRNTYTFAAPIIINGKKTDYTNQNSRMPGGNNDLKGLQLLCQINDNNFVLFTAGNATRNTGINKFLELGCKTAVNLDGGGSVALIYKEKGSNEINTVIGNARSLPEVGYFSES